MAAPLLSLCLVVRDEAQLLAGALAARDVADECVVVDTGSTDGTPEIARGLGARVVHHPWTGSLGQARNRYLAEARGRWVLVLDGDERLAPLDLPKIRPLLAASDTVAYRFTVHDYTRTMDLLRDWHPNSGVYAAEEAASGCPGHTRFPVVRLFRRAPGVRYEEGFSVHTNPVDALRRLGGAIRDADVVVHHFQILKGGEPFVRAKQAARLSGELRHLEGAPDHFLANLNVGRTLFALGRDEEALGYLDRALAVDPKAEQVYLVRGLVRFERRELDRAVRDLEEAVTVRPVFADAWAVLGMAYHGLGRVAEAERALRIALGQRPHHPLAVNSLGVLYMDLGRFDEAEEQFARALRLLPDHPAAGANLADLRAQRALKD